MPAWLYGELILGTVIGGVCALVSQLDAGDADTQLDITLEG
jgi:hypothetical protein